MERCKSASEWHIISDTRMQAASGVVAFSRSMSTLNCNPFRRRRVISLLAASMTASVRLFRNDLENGGNWLLLRVMDTRVKRDAIGAQGPPAPMVQNGRALNIRPIGDLETRYYLRLTVADRPGVLAQISRLLGDDGISLASVIQKDSDPAQQTAELVITTHPAREASVQKSLQQVSALDVVTRINNLLRIEE